MKPKHLLSLSVLLISAACSQPEQKPLTQYVDMYIGTGGHGHVFMGANVPFGAVQLGPTSIPQSWDWVSGYHISDTWFFWAVRLTMKTSSFSLASSTPMKCAAPSMPVPLAWTTVPPPAPSARAASMMEPV